MFNIKHIFLYKKTQYSFIVLCNMDHLRITSFDDIDNPQKLNFNYLKSNIIDIIHFVRIMSIKYNIMYISSYIIDLNFKLEITVLDASSNNN